MAVGVGMAMGNPSPGTGLGQLAKWVASGRGQCLSITADL